MSKIILTPEVHSVLENSQIDATSVRLPAGHLDRKLYEQVNKVLLAAGGKWNKSAKAHLFTIDPRSQLGLALERAVIIDHAKTHKKVRQAFYTPEAAANTVAQLADVHGRTVLEPSAGHGALAQACMRYGAHSVDCVEMDPEANKALLLAGYQVRGWTVQNDFLKFVPCPEDDPYERIVMNPPFTRKADARHVFHAFNHWLQPQGLLTAIVCDDGKDRADLLEEAWSIRIVHRFPKGTFRESGTDIATLVIQITK